MAESAAHKGAADIGQQTIQVRLPGETALLVGVDIGLYPMVGTVGGLAVTIPAMLVLYVPTGLVEGIVTSSLVVTFSQAKAVRLFGLELLRNGRQKNGDASPSV